MAKKGVIALIACVFALCLALVGCGGGGGGNAEANNKAAFVGTWDLVEMSQDGQVTGSDDLETLKSLGLEVFVNFNEDNTMALSLFGESMEGTWEAKSATEGSIELEGQTADMTIADSKLTFEQDGASLTFEKGEAKEASASSSAEESAVVEEETTESESAAAEEATESESESAAEESASATAEESESASASAEEAAESESSTADEAAEEESSSSSEE